MASPLLARRFSIACLSCVLSCVLSCAVIGCTFDPAALGDDPSLGDATTNEVADVGDAAMVREADVGEASDGSTGDAPPDAPHDADACALDATCDTSDPCKDVVVECGDGKPTCKVVGPRPNGTPCGTNAVCDAGVCTVCTSGVSCTPTEACHLGVTDCTSGASVCVAKGDRPDGPACAPGRSCKSGVCTCNAPTTECAGKCVDLSSDAANCGACGVVCPLGCRSGTCESYGGAYEVGCDFASCGTGFACEYANDRTGACTCPAGTVAMGTDVFQTEIDLDEFGICFPSPLPKNADFGGTYLVKDVAAGCRLSDSKTPLPPSGCDIKNPLTGACSCPAGFTAIGVRAIAYCDDGTTTVEGSWFYWCWNATAPQVSFGGVYELRDDGGCAVANAATGACSCPTGATPHAYRLRIDVPSTMGATLFVCDR